MRERNTKVINTVGTLFHEPKTMDRYERIADWFDFSQSGLDMRVNFVEALKAETERCAVKARNAQLPEGYQYGEDAMSNFKTGTKAASDAVRSVKCSTCDGHGMVYGSTGGAVPEPDGQPCPDCSRSIKRESKDG